MKTTFKSKLCLIVSLVGWGLTETDFTSDALKEIKVGSFIFFFYLGIPMQRILEFCNLYLHSVSSQVLIFGESECQANVEENGLDFSQGMLCAEEGTCHVRRSQYFKREKLQKN